MRIQDIQKLAERSLDPLVHGSVASDAGEAEKHRRFIATHGLAGAVALALVPPALAFQSVPPFLVATLAMLGVEALAALWVSRTGRLGVGHLFSAAVLTAAVIVMAGATGGIGSAALLWLAVVPIEASLSGDRRVIRSAAAIAAVGLAAAATTSFAGLLPPPVETGRLGSLAGGIVALAYAVSVALRIEAGHRSAERRRRAEEVRYRLLAESMTDMVTCHGADGGVVLTSPAAERLIDATPRMLAGDGLFRRVHVADRPAFLAALSAALHAGQAQVEFRLRRGDLDDPESFLWVETLMRRTAGDAEWSVVAVTRDIGRRKAQEAEIERAREDAEMASFAKTRFLANMSHELRTPLNAIIGFSDILGQELFGKLEFERHREYARLIKDSGEHLLQVVNDILDMSKIEAGSFDITPEPFEIAPVVERCRQIMSPQAARAGVELVTTVEAGLPEVVADRRACRQILLNLLSNAIKFTDEGGRVECGARCNGAEFQLFVRDNGIGIAAQDLPRLGNPFFQAECGYDRRAEGTGLGLSVVKGLATLHGGTLTIDSTPGRGTTVTVSLPVRPEHDRGRLLPLPVRRPLPAEPGPLARRA